jgi:hypothetical protein
MNNDLIKGLEQLLSEHDETASREIEEQLLQRLIEFCIKSYAYKIEKLPNDAQFQPLSNEDKVMDTELLVLVNKLLEFKHIELFEVQMFRSLCNS